MDYFETLKQRLSGLQHAVIVCDKSVSLNLCSQISMQYPNLWIDWVWQDLPCDTNNHICIKLQNPRGISNYHLNEKQQLWLFSGRLNTLPEHFFGQKIINLSNEKLSEQIISTNQNTSLRPWFSLPERIDVENVIVIGAGIAGASTAYALARRGIKVQVISDTPPATAASGNKQGLLYAKISAYDTMQTRLLLQSYIYTRNLLDELLEKDYWSDCGVLHLDDGEAEEKRNRQLSCQVNNLYRYINADEATNLAGIPLNKGGLYWQYGAWIHPVALVKKLLSHPNIQVTDNIRITSLSHQDNWQLIDTNKKAYRASHVVLCCGADRILTNDCGLNMQVIRGQTDCALATNFSGRLKIALSGKSYISPAWRGTHCFGATFIPNDDNNEIRSQDSDTNLHNLSLLHKQLRDELTIPADYTHAAVRVDAYDHLPVVGSVGDAKLMRKIYSHLAFDKKYPYTQACPYLQGLYINSAHGTRGLCTAPLCGEAVAAQILGLPHPFDNALRQALSPNRLIVHDLVHQ